MARRRGILTILGTTLPSIATFGFLLILLLSCSSADVIERSIQILNESGHRVEVHWVHPQTGEMVLQSTPDILHGASQGLNSFVGHRFQVREMPAKKTGVCSGEGQVCRIAYFTVNKNKDQNIFIREGFTIEHTDNKSIAKESAGDLLSGCQRKALSAIKSSSASPTGAIDDLVSCVESGVALELEKANEEISFQATVRKGMADLLENYTCADHELNTTKAERSETWVDRDRVRRNVDVLLDRPASKVHIVKNFISDEECEAMEKAAKPLLHKATVADGSGGSHLSESRKAMQAGIKVPWDKEKDGDHIAILSRRVYDYVNHVLDLDIKEDGQEDLMSIQYFGRGEDDETPDRYMPHCDGDCTGLDFKPGTRMATMVMYCTIPKKGGATNFRNSGLHVVPEKGGATFFSYLDTVSMKMDSGFTEHSGCPVVEGEKKIVTQWVRLGVDKANPWTSFNTLGVKYSDAANQ